MSRGVDTTAPMPKTWKGCIRELSRILREMAVEYDQFGESAKWQELRDRKEAIKKYKAERWGNG